MIITLLSWLEVAVGVLIWCGVLWDGFATVILPRTVAPMRRLSGRFYRSSWALWAAVGRTIQQSRLRLVFLSVYGPLSVMLLLNLWAGLIIVAFALIFQGLGPRFLSAPETLSFGRLLYMSGSIFLTLGLGDVTSPDSIAWLFILLEAASGYIFLALVITYMPVLEQADSAREVGNLADPLAPAARPARPSCFAVMPAPSAPRFCEAFLREAERWMAENLQSHLSHPVLSFYRAQHWGQSWLISLTTVLDTCALLIAGGDGLLASQARITYRMGICLLKDLSDALSLKVDRRSHARLHTADLPALLATIEAANLALRLGPNDVSRLVRLVRRYDPYLVALSEFLVIPLPLWIQPRRPRRESAAPDARRARLQRPISTSTPQVGLTNPADGPVDTSLEKQSHDPRSDQL